MKLAVIIFVFLCLWETEVMAKTAKSFGKKDRGRGGLWKKRIVVELKYKDQTVYCNKTLPPEVHVQYVLAGCNITLAHPNRPKSQSWLRAVLKPEEQPQKEVQASSKQTAVKPLVVLKEALIDCNRFGDIANMHVWYNQMCYGFAPLNDTTISRRNATITSPGVLSIANITVDDSGIYQGRSGRSYREFNLQIEKPHFKIKVVTKNQTVEVRSLPE